MKRVMLLCLLIPIFAFGQPGEYYYAQSTGNLNFVLYTVKQQEPYKDIATRFGLSVQELMYLNGGNVHSIASIGDQMIVPLTSKNYFRWKDIPADISVQPVYVQLKRETDLQEIIHKYHLRADFFEHWNDIHESRFDAGAELIVGYVAYNTQDNPEEKPLTKSFPFTSHEEDPGMIRGSKGKDRDYSNEDEEVALVPKKPKVLNEPKRVVQNYVEEEEPIVAPNKKRIIPKPIVKEFVEKEEEPMVAPKKQRVLPKRIVKEYVEEEGEPIVAPKKQKITPQPKRLVKEYVEEEEEPIVAPKKQRIVPQPKHVVKEYVEEVEEPIVAPKKQRVLPQPKRVVKEYVEEEEEPIVTPKKQRVVSQPKPIVKEYVEEEEEPMVAPKKQRVVPRPKPISKEYVEEEEEPVVAPKKQRVVTQPRRVVKEYVEEEEEPIVTPKKQRVLPKPIVKEYAEEEEEPIVAPKKQKVAPQPKRRVKENVEEEEETIVTPKKQRVAIESKQVVKNNDQEEDEYEAQVEEPKKNNNPNIVANHTGGRNKYKGVNGKIDTSFLNTTGTTRIQKQKNAYGSASRNEDRIDQLNDKAISGKATKSSKKSQDDQNEYDQNDTKWAQKKSIPVKSTNKNTPKNRAVTPSIKDASSNDVEFSDSLSDDGIALNEVPLDEAGEEINNEDAQTKPVVKSSKQKKHLEKAPENTDEIAQDATELQPKPDKQNQRGGRASLFLAGLGKRGSKHYAVTNLASRGETIVITNTSNGKYIIAEVIGPLPVRELSKGILLKVSENAKSDLDINSNFFNVMVNY